MPSQTRSSRKGRIQPTTSTPHAPQAALSKAKSDALVTSGKDDVETGTKRGRPSASEDEEVDLPAQLVAFQSTPKNKRRRRRNSVSPVPTPSPRTRTNEHPGLIGKSSRRAKGELAAEKAAKKSKAAANAAAEDEAVTQLAAFELNQAAEETHRREAVVRKKPTAPFKAITVDSDMDVDSSSSSDGDSYQPDAIDEGADSTVSSESSDSDDDQSSMDLEPKVSSTTIE
jgi:hypothetical protein